MHIVIYANPESQSYRQLNHALDSLNLNQAPEIFNRPDLFCERFRSDMARPDVVILMPVHSADLDALIGARDLFENIRTIVILPENEPTTLAKGHKFHPSFMAFHDDDFGMLAAVLGHMDRHFCAVPETTDEQHPPVEAPPVSSANEPQRFATFIIDRDKGTELAIDAEHMLEATAISGIIQPLPSGVDFLEGFMHLRDDAIPVINLKKRLGLSPTDHAADAKVAVVGFSGLRFGLLFDDIKDVLLVTDEMIHPIHPTLLTDVSPVTDLIKLDEGRRTMQLLDLQRLFGDIQLALDFSDKAATEGSAGIARHRVYKRYVVFAIGNQHYGIPVDQTQEITFLTSIDQTFKNEIIEGSLELRGRCIPVINATHLLQHTGDDWQPGAETRVLVMDSDDFQYGMIVDRILEILCIADDTIMRLPQADHGAVEGIFQHTDGRSIMLIAPSALIGSQHNELKSVARLKACADKAVSETTGPSTRHLITAECYLVFSIGSNFAVELNDVQEIIEPADLMDLPGKTGIDHRVLNLRGTAVPVVNLREFYGYEGTLLTENAKLIIARKEGQTVALEVDQIITIYKQVQYQRTPSLNPRFNGKKDTLDRLIEFVDETGIKEHVLVVNVEAMMRNHLGLISDHILPTEPNTAKENRDGINTAQPS